MGEAAEVLGPIGELKAHALVYAERGLEVFPLLPDKAPRTDDGFKNGTTDADQIEAWWTAHPGDLIGHRIAGHHVILDIDPRHGGDKTWAAIREECGGVWPATRGHKSGRGDGGGHTWWLRPDDKLTSLKLDTFARERCTGHAVIDKTTGKPYVTGGIERWTSGIDILHHDLRYTILPPSPHPDTGAPYTWIDGKGLEVVPAPMPAFLADLITTDLAPAKAPVVRDPDPSSIADWYSDTHSIGDLLQEAGWQLVAGDGRQDGSRWRHPTASSSCSATIRYGCLFVYTPNTPFEVTAPGDSHGYTPFRAYTVLKHHGDASAAARAAREMKDGPAPARINVADLIDITPTSTPVPSDVEETPRAPAHLPEEFWTARPIFEHIRTAARSRLVAPDAVLGACLARVAAITPHTVELPPTVGKPCGLTFYAALTGPPEAGKSAAVSIAAELLPVPAMARVLDRLPLGSGEGLIENFFEMQPDPSDDSKNPKMVKTQVFNAAIVHVDEGKALEDLGGRSGSTLLPTIRSAWTHEPLGQANASIEKRRMLRGHEYVYGLTLCIQPEIAGPLLADTAAGTPQRFVWFKATDPSEYEDPDWPGELDWEPPGPGMLERHVISRGGWRRHQLHVADEIRAEVRAYRKDTLSEKVTREAVDAHQVLSRLKIAALLAVLDCRLNVDNDDWRLAGLILATSHRVRNQVQGSVADVERRKEEAGINRRVRAELTTDQAKEQRSLATASKSANGVVATHEEEGRHAALGGGCTRHCINSALSKARRADVGVDAAALEAERLGWIRADGDRWFPGESRPA